MRAGAPHGVVLLAAGRSRRLGVAKQLLEISGEPLVRRAARLALATSPLDAVVVTGADSAFVERAVRGLAVRCVRAEDFEEGMGRSLAAGLTHLDPACAGALVVLCDQPALTAEHLARLVEVWRAAPDSAAASGYAGTVGVPALLPRAWFPLLIAARGDRGARDLLRESAGGIQIVPDERLAQDVDHPEEAAGLETRSQ
ncbi:MAG TPA: nucleotidyltransferase family protein [Thermoanaerobaculia bacterium]|nr:nucleotidyltransferase family protein [Thermoanaerobaculia bacterium]